MWRKEALDTSDPEHIAATMRVLTISDRVVRGKDATLSSPSDLAMAPTIACWAMIHGFVALVVDGAFFAGEADPIEKFGTLLDATLKHLVFEQE